KITLAQETDRSARGATDRCFVEGKERGAAIGLTYHPRMRHAVERHVMNESGLAVELCRQVKARGAPPNNRIIGGPLTPPCPRRPARQADRRRERPIIEFCRSAVAQHAAVPDGEVRRRATEALRGGLQKQRARLRAGLAQRDTARLHRLAASGI